MRLSALQKKTNTMKHLLLLWSLFSLGCPAGHAQTYSAPCATAQSETAGSGTFKAFDRLDIGLSAGSTGVGVDLSMPLTGWMQVRAGFDYMPRIHVNMNFGIQVGDEPESGFDASGNPVETKFDRLSAMLEQITGYKVDRSIDMIGRPTACNAKLLFDFFPLRNRHWHVTAGVYYGPRQFAEAYNTTEDMPSLVAVGMYNKMYEIAETYPDGEGGFENENMKPFFSMGGKDIYSPDLAQKFLSYGRMGVGIGYRNSDGKVYRMEPDENSMVKARMLVNRIKPYLGVGYGGALSKHDPTYRFSFDCGVMFWGGTPSVVTHDGTDLVHDVHDISGKVGRYVRAAKQFKVYPVVSLRLSKTIF